MNAPAGSPVWKGFITPYTPGTATPDPASTVEVRCIEPLPHAVAKLKTVYSKKTKKVTVTGVLLANGRPRAGVNFHVPAGLTPNPSSWKDWAATTTNARGAFTIVKKLCVREDTSGEFGPFFVMKPKK